MKGQVVRNAGWMGTSAGLGTTRSEPENTGPDSTSLSLGQRVRHPKFGEGIVLNSEGKGANTRVQINFDDAGGKWLVMAYARLEVIA